MDRVAITVPELAEQTGKSKRVIYEWARREVDPLPICRIDGNRYGFVLVSEFEDWARRNRAECAGI